MDTEEDVGESKDRGRRQAGRPRAEAALSHGQPVALEITPAVPLSKLKNPERSGRTVKRGQGEKFSHSSKRNCCPGIVHGTVMLISEKQCN